MDHTFLLYHRTFHCLNCQHNWETSELYRIEIRGDMRRVEPSFSEPIAGMSFGISRLQPRNTALCHLCAPSFEIKHNRDLDEREASWHETLRRKSAENTNLYTIEGFRRPTPRPISRAAAARAAEPSLDDL